VNDLVFWTNGQQLHLSARIEHLLNPCAYQAVPDVRLWKASSRKMVRLVRSAHALMPYRYLANMESAWNWGQSAPSELVYFTARFVARITDSD
jgi:hypothetical protein